MARPTISIVIPSYNQAQWLDAAIRSVVDQDEPVEILVFDGGSTDGSVEVIKRYEDRLSYWQSQPDGGQSMAIREGFRKASGDVLGWLNSDDMLCPGALTAVADAFEADPLARWGYGHSVTIDEDGNRLISRPSVQITPDDLFNLHLYLPQESTFFRRDAYMQAGEVDPDLNMSMDYDLWLRLAKQGAPILIDAPLGMFRVVSGQKSADVETYMAEEAATKARHADAFTPWSNARKQARMAQIRATRMRMRLEEDGPKSMIEHGKRVFDGGQVSPGSTRADAVKLIASAGGAIALTAATLGWAIGRLRRR